MTALLFDFAQLGDPIPPYQFDVMWQNKPWVEVASVKATSKQLKLTFVPMTNSKPIDMSGSPVTIRIYQTIADADNADGTFISIRYHLKKLQGIHLALDGASIGTSPMDITQVYEIERVEFF